MDLKDLGRKIIQNDFQHNINFKGQEASGNNFNYLSTSLKLIIYPCKCYINLSDGYNVIFYSRSV